MNPLMNELSGLLFLFAVVFAVSYLLLKWQRSPHVPAEVSDGRGHHLRLPPALPAVPVLGSLPFLVSADELPAFFMQKSKELGDVFSFYAGSRYVLVLNGREAIWEAFVKRGNDFAGRYVFYAGLYISRKLFGERILGVVNNDFNSNFKHLKQLTLAILKQFGLGKRIMESRILTEVETMIHHIRDHHGRPFDPEEIVTSSVANVTLNILFGRRFDHGDPELRQVLADVASVIRLVSPEIDIFPFTRFLPHVRNKVIGCSAAYEGLYKFCDRNVTSLSQDESNDDNFVKSFINAQGPTFDRVELSCILADLTVGGTDTTSTTVLWFLIVMANHRSIQDRLHADIDAAVDIDQLPQLDDRKRLPYLEAAVMETMRYRTLVPFGMFHTTVQDTQVNGCFVPSGTPVLPNLYSVHMDPESWKQPDQFRPERFLDADGFAVDQEKTIPFSLGKRSCIGEQLARQEVFLFTAGLLQQFDIRPPEDQDHIDDRWKFGVTLSPLKFMVRLIPRR